MLNTRAKGRLFVVSGPSGVGKGTMMATLTAQVPKVVVSVSATTRAPRPGEVDGVNYHFLTREQFEADIPKGRFLEYAQYGANFYGTPKDHIETLLCDGVDVVLEIEVKGAMQVKALAPDAILIYIQPPSLTELERRLRGRQTETEDKILQRLQIAESEQQSVCKYDYCITNDDLTVATTALVSIVIAERHRIQK